MDGRTKLAAAGGLVLSALVGCTTTAPKVPSAPPQAPPAEVGKNSLFVPEPPDDKEKKDGPLASSTLLVFASAWVDAVAKDPNRSAADRDRTLGRARQVYQEVLQREPGNVDALLGLGDLYQLTGELEQLKEVEARAAKLHPQNARVWAWLALRRAQAKDFDGAALAYHKAVQLDPDNRLYRTHLGFTLARGGRYDEGYEWLSRCMREPEARYNLAMMMVHTGQPEKARMELRLALKADPNFQPAIDQLAALTADAPKPEGEGAEKN